MYLPVTPQPDCASAWREAVRSVDGSPGHEAHNVILSIANPTAGASLQDPRVKVVDDFLQEREKSVETIANTIFPAALYLRHGYPQFFKVFEERVLAKVRRNERWSGYYFERMINLPNPNGKPVNQLWEIVDRISNKKTAALSKFEVIIFDPTRDVDNSPYGGQCLSFGSFKIVPGDERKISLTVMYRNHFYIEKLLGNLIGLGRLISFVAAETKLALGDLTVVSTHAQIDHPKTKDVNCTRTDVLQMIKTFDQRALELAVHTPGKAG